MKKKIKVLFVASTQNKARNCFDGETMKSEAIKDVLERNFDVTLVNLSEHKFFRTLKLCFLSLFKKYDYYIISKYPHGADIILSIFRHLHVNKKKIYYLVIGAAFPDLVKENKVIKAKNFRHLNRIICEAEYAKDSLEKIGFDNVDVLPNFKKIYELEEQEKVYPKEVLKLCFLSRLVEGKGLIELINIIKELNKDSLKFQLDIFGKATDKDFLNEVCSLQDENISYRGFASLKSKDDYLKLQAYDLHAFPTKFYTEGVPGSIVDFLIADVPTISSRFANYKGTIDDSTAFIYEFGSNEALKEMLIHIYTHQQEINEKRMEIRKIIHKFSEESFEKGLLDILEVNNYGSK